TINFAVDSIKEKPGLPKAFEQVRSNFDYLVRRQYRYGYTVFFNTNICRTNIDDVKELATIAHDNGISITFHINEAPMMEQGHFKHLHENDTYIRPEDFPLVDELLDWLIVRTNGTLAPCFPLYNATYDWGTVGNEKFDVKQLAEMKKGCEPNCFSTLGYNVAYCYSAARVMKWLCKQALNGFQGVTGSFE